MCHSLSEKGDALGLALISSHMAQSHGQRFVLFALQVISLRICALRALFHLPSYFLALFIFSKSPLQFLLSLRAFWPFTNQNTQRYDFYSLLILVYFCINLVSSWICLCFCLSRVPLSIFLFLLPWTLRVGRGPFRVPLPFAT